MFGLVLPEITRRVRIYHPRRVPVYIKKVRGRRQKLEIEVSRRRCSGRARQVERRASSDWLRFRAPLVTLVTCRQQVSSIYRTVNNRSRSILAIQNQNQSLTVRTLSLYGHSESQQGQNLGRAYESYRS